MRCSNKRFTPHKGCQGIKTRNTFIYNCYKLRRQNIWYNEITCIYETYMRFFCAQHQSLLKKFVKTIDYITIQEWHRKIFTAQNRRSPIHNKDLDLNALLGHRKTIKSFMRKPQDFN